MHISQRLFTVKHRNEVRTCQALPPNDHPAVSLCQQWPQGRFGRGVGIPASFSCTCPGLLESFRQIKLHLDFLTQWTSVESMISLDGMESHPCLLRLALGLSHRYVVVRSWEHQLIVLRWRENWILSRAGMECQGVQAEKEMWSSWA